MLEAGSSAPNWEQAAALWAEMRPLLERLLAAPSGPRASQVIPRVPGVYLFSDGERYRYVGQTRNLRERLGQHTRPSGTHYSATLAFLMAVKQAALMGIDLGRQRAVLEKTPEFGAHFVAAKGQVAAWNVQFIELDDPNVRTVFEVYVHLVLRTDLNSFETH